MQNKAYTKIPLVLQRINQKLRPQIFETDHDQYFMRNRFRHL